MEDMQDVSTSRKRPSKAHIGVVQCYLKREVPGQLKRTRWDKKLMAQVFEMVNSHGLRHIAIDSGVFLNCPDFGAKLFDSELADYIRESQAPRRCFLVVWQEGTLRIRSKPL